MRPANNTFNGNCDVMGPPPTNTQTAGTVGSWNLSVIVINAECGFLHMHDRRGRRIKPFAKNGPLKVTGKVVNPLKKRFLGDKRPKLSLAYN